MEEVCKVVLTENLFQLSKELGLGSSMVLQHNEDPTDKLHIVNK